MTYVALIGLVLVLVRSSIFNRLRPRLKILACAQCTGWWVGLFAWKLVPSVSDISFMGVRYVDALVSAFSVSAMAFLANSILTHLVGDVLTAEEKKS